MTDLATLDRQIEYGVTSTDVLASMPGLDFVRAMFAGKVPAPPIMQTVEPFGQSAEPGVVAFHSIPGFRHYNPIGSVHGGYAATLLDSAMGLAIHSMLPAGTGYTTLEFKISFIKGHDQGFPAWSAPKARCSMPAAAPPPPKGASPTPRAGCWRTPPRRAWFSSFPKPPEDNRSLPALEP